ncbi:MAG: citrate synthase/methylcitrate synthase [Candidatus Omnitrophica bacterium]|nr:citrate synthase/methylcitrate synthase [Candidatus Omnitrophota bacterium]
MHEETKEITSLISKAARLARQESSHEPEPGLTKPIEWPVNCLVGPGLEGAIACESKIGYVNGSKGWLIYRGYDIFDLCAHSNFEEVSYLLLYGHLPSVTQFNGFKDKLIKYRNIPSTIRLIVNFPVEEMNAMAALRFGVNLMRQECTSVDRDSYKTDATIISADEDSIAMETRPKGEKHAIYEFERIVRKKAKDVSDGLHPAAGYESSWHLISGVVSVAGAIARLRQGNLPIDPDLNLSHAANLIYMITGNRPNKIEERIMDTVLILHADHGINASTFATLVVCSTLSDMYFAVGSGIAALNGPLHGGANEQVLHMLKEIGGPKNVSSWYAKARSKKKKIMGFGHRVYKAYDPRARILGPLAEYLVNTKGDSDMKKLLATAQSLEKEVITTLGVEKKIFPNVDFYSGIVYSCLGIPVDLFTSIFAVSRVVGWTARAMEYLENNRIFRPRAMYTGPFNKKYRSLDQRSGKAGKSKVKKK